MSSFLDKEMEDLKEEEYKLVHLIFKLNKRLLFNSLQSEPIVKWDEDEKSCVQQQREGIINTINHFEAELGLVQTKKFLLEKAIS